MTNNDKCYYIDKNDMSKNESYIYEKEGIKNQSKSIIILEMFIKIKNTLLIKIALSTNMNLQKTLKH